MSPNDHQATDYRTHKTPSMHNFQYIRQEPLQFTSLIFGVFTGSRFSAYLAILSKVARLIHSERMLCIQHQEWNKRQSVPNSLYGVNIPSFHQLGTQGERWDGQAQIWRVHHQCTKNTPLWLYPLVKTGRHIIMCEYISDIVFSFIKKSTQFTYSNIL